MEIDDPFESSAFFKNGFNGQGIHLRSEFTENLTSNLSLTRSLNFLDIDLDAVISETTVEVEFVGNEQEKIITKSKDSIKYNLKVNVPVYTLREDISYRLTPKLHLEPGFLLAFSPARTVRSIPVYPVV